MAIQKSKIGAKKKGAKKKLADPFARKEWYDVKAPGTFQVRQVCKTPVTKTTGNKVARDNLVGRVFESSLGDLMEKADDDAFRKFKLKVEEVQGRSCLTNFYGMCLTTDKLRSLVRKWQTLIEAHVDVKTTDGFSLRIFCIGFTRRRMEQTRKTSYAQHSQIKTIRKRMVDIMRKHASSSDLKDFVHKLIADVIGRDVEKATMGIYPLQNVFVRKVKVLHAPKLDIKKLLDLHGGQAAVEAEEAGRKVVAEPEAAAEVKPEAADE